MKANLVIPPPNTKVVNKDVFADPWYKFLSQLNGFQLGIVALQDEVDAMGIVSAWQSFTPVVTSTTGTITTASGVMRYMTIGKLLVFNATLTVTTNGTGATSVQFTLPVTASVNAIAMGVGRETAVSGRGLVCLVTAGASVGIITRSDTGAYPAADGAAMQITQCYEIP